MSKKDSVEFSNLVDNLERTCASSSQQLAALDDAARAVLTKRAIASVEGNPPRIDTVRHLIEKGVVSVEEFKAELRHGFELRGC